MWIAELAVPSTSYSTAQAPAFPEATFEIGGRLIKFTVENGLLKASTTGSHLLDLDTSSSDKVSNAKVTSMDLSIGPNGDIYFLALAVNSDVDWPGTSDLDKPEIMKINE